METGGRSGAPQTCPQDMQPGEGKPGTLVSLNTWAAEPGYHNLSLVVWLIGCANEAPVVVEGAEMIALVDTGSQMSTLTKGFCTEIGLRILP